MVSKRQLRVASNTGPLISAFQVKRSDLFARYFETISVPPTVVGELIRHGFESQTRVEQARESAYLCVRCTANTPTINYPLSWPRR
jgi:hypothetical protein